MTKITGRIPTGKFSYIEIEETVETKEQRDAMIPEMLDIIEAHIKIDETSGSPEVILDGKNCPKCGAQMIQQIGISAKTKKPYHRIKCINNRGDNATCDHIQWINVSELK